MPKLIYKAGQVDAQTFDVRPGATHIGRTTDNDIFILDKSLSRKHARIDRDGERYAITDLESKNGTFVNGARITRADIRPGDAIRLGDVLLVFGDAQTAAQPAVLPTVVMGLATEMLPASIDQLLRQGKTGGAIRVRGDEAARRAQDKLQILLKVSEVLSSPDTLDVLLRKTLDLVFQILDVDRAAILMVDPESGKLEPRVTRSNRGDESSAIYSQNIVEYVRRESVAALFSDATIDPRLESAHSVVLQSIRSSMCVPLKPRDKVLGVLYVDNLSVPNRFVQEDLEFLTAFASQAAVAIENANLWRRIEEEAVIRNTLVRFFPPATIRKVMESRAASLDAHETEVTALFSDISGFTAMSSQMRPREVVAMLNEYFPIMADIVFRHEGTLEKYIGDALMAIWGAPFAHDDDADRAVRAAAEMQRAVRELSARWATKGLPAIEIHVGLNTGTVAVGNIGSEQYVQYAAIGDATNVASRVCTAAQANEVLISESTFARLRDKSIPVERLAPVFVKGKDQAIQLHKVDWAKLIGAPPVR